MKVRYSGQWKDSDPYVRHNGIWKPATSSFKYDGEWISDISPVLEGKMISGYRYSVVGGNFYVTNRGYDDSSSQGYGSISPDKIPKLGNSIITGFKFHITEDSNHQEITVSSSFIIDSPDYEGVSVLIRLNNKEIIDSFKKTFYRSYISLDGDIWGLRDISEGTSLDFYIEVLE